HRARAARSRGGLGVRSMAQHPRGQGDSATGTTATRASCATMQTIRPVTYEETDARYRTVNTLTGMAAALMAHCNERDPARQAAARACIALSAGKGDPEETRALFVRALEAAGVFVRS